MSDPYIAQIVMFGGNFAIRSWAFCDGQLLPIAQNQALFSLLGTTYGGDGRTSFGLPDMRGRMPVHPGNGPGLNPVRLGQKSGHTSVVLNQANLPSHSHAVTSTLHGVEAAGDQASPSGNFLAEGSTSSNYVASARSTETLNPASVTSTASNTGSGQSFDITNPYLAVNFEIALLGVFPSRN